MPTKEELTTENAQLKKQASTLKGQVTKAKKELQNQAGYVADLERESAEVAEGVHTQLEAERAAAIKERNELRRTVDDKLLIIERLHKVNTTLKNNNIELEDDNERLRDDVMTARNDSLRAQQNTKSKSPWAGLLAIAAGIAVVLIVAYVLTAAYDFITHDPEPVELEPVAEAIPEQPERPVELPDPVEPLPLDTDQELNVLDELDELDSEPEFVEAPAIPEVVEPLPPTLKKQEAVEFAEESNIRDYTEASVGMQWSNLRLLPDSSDDNNIIGTYDVGTPIYLIEERDRWFRVVIEGPDGGIGYMHRSTIQF